MRRGSGPVPASSHSLPPDQIVALAKEMAGALPSGVFVAIGARSFTLGGGLSAEVRAGLPDFAAAIEREIRRLAEPRHDT